jgi:hypothetical protein
MNPVFSLGQTAILQPAVRIAHHDTVEDILGRSE